MQKFFLYLFSVSFVWSIGTLLFVPNSRYYQTIGNQQSINEKYNAEFDYNFFEMDEVAVAKQLLHIEDTIHTVQKVLRIQEFLFDTIAHHQTKIAQFPLPNSASLQYLQDAMNHKMVPDCGAYTQMMNLFFYANHIPFRRVGVTNIQDTSIGNHVFSEVYIPQSSQWMFTDMNTNKLSIQDSFGNYLNTQQVQQAITDKNYTPRVMHYINDTLQNSQWKNVLGAEQRCFLPLVDYTYYNADHLTILQKFKKLWYPNPWCTVVSQSYIISNNWYWCRLAVMTITLFSGVGLLFFAKKTGKWFFKKK